MKAEEPAAASHHDEATADLIPSNLVTVSKAQIAEALRSSILAPTAAAAIGQTLGLDSKQLSALTGGQADLQLTQVQYDNLRSSVAKLYHEGQDNVDAQSGSLCGSSSPAPTTSAMTQVPSVTTTGTQVTETTAGTKQKEEKVGSGTVTVRTDVKGTFPGGSRDNLFAISYKGTDSKDAHWLQFIHREIVGINSDGSAHPQTGSIATTGGSYKLTTGGTDARSGTATKDNYNTDTAGSTPFYESGGINNRSADATTMYDQPSAADARVQAAFSAGATRVISRAHFDTFLVTVDKVTYHVQIDVVYDYSSATATPSPVTTMASAGAATALPSEIKQKFDEQWPAYKFIK
jgi:hypothetical protein